MIKLIASDMDGTLLQNGEREVSKEALEYIEVLLEKGVLFAPASGRQYINLRNNFAPIKDKIIYICENGGFVKYKGETLYKAALDRKLGIAIMEDIYNKNNCEILLSGEETSYLMPKSQAYVEHMVNYVKNQVTIIKSFDEVKEDFIKISVFEPEGIERSSDYFHDKWCEFTHDTVSGKCWLDFVPIGVHKGTAISHIQQKFNITKMETMVFGDNYNDLEMFDRAYFSYAMEGANSEIRAAASYTSADVESVLHNLIPGSKGHAFMLA